jgi:hypothetical protein
MSRPVLTEADFNQDERAAGFVFFFGRPPPAGFV